MENLTGFFQLIIGLVALYVTLYQILKKKYKKKENINLSKKQLKQNEKVEYNLGVLNTIFIIIFFTVFILYLFPIKNFINFFYGDVFTSSQGKIFYITSSVISCVLILVFILMSIFRDDMFYMLDDNYQFIFLAFLYIFCVLILLILNQFIIPNCMKFMSNSVETSIFAIIMAHMFLDMVLFFLLTGLFLGYCVLIDFLCDKFTDE